MQQLSNLQKILNNFMGDDGRIYLGQAINILCNVDSQQVLSEVIAQIPQENRLHILRKIQEDGLERLERADRTIARLQEAGKDQDAVNVQKQVTALNVLLPLLSEIEAEIIKTDNPQKPLRRHVFFTRLLDVADRKNSKASTKLELHHSIEDYIPLLVRLTPNL